MKHLMLDLYGVRADTTDLECVNEMMNRFINELSLKAVMPVSNVPYYYCSPQEDGGISSFCLLDNGHITLHTFPFYGTCYIDVMFADIDREKVEPFVRRVFDPKRIDLWCFDRDSEKCSANYTPENGFGPHVLVTAASEKTFGVGDVYELLESLPEQIGMHPITRPTVLTNRMRNYNVVSGIVLIAESHIAFHQDVQTKKVYLDIYSCKFCEPERLYEAVEKLLGKDFRYQLISRGEKQERIVLTGYSRSDNGWRNNI